MSSSSPCAPYFVMAHHRSGSNFLNDLLQSHPRIECINEPLSMHTPHFRACDLDAWSADDFDAKCLHASLAPDADLRAFLFDFRRYLCESNPQRVIGFKDTVLFGKLGWLKAFLPSLKIVFLKRDPRSIVSSVLRSNLQQFWNYADRVRPTFKALYPAYESRIEPADGATAMAEMVAMSIVARYELARRTIQRFDHMELHLEALMLNPGQELGAVTSFLGVDMHERPLSFLKQRQTVSRGGLFSSFRARDEVEHLWKHHLNAAQLQAIEDVLRCQSA